MAARRYVRRALRRLSPKCLLRPIGRPHPLRQPSADAQIWNPSSRALVNPYAVLEEPVVAVSAYQRLRQPLVLGASVLVVTSAVYLGFIHGNDRMSARRSRCPARYRRRMSRRWSSFRSAHGRCAGAVRLSRLAETATVVARSLPPSPPRNGPVAAQRPAAGIAQEPLRPCRRNQASGGRRFAARHDRRRHASTPLRSPPIPPRPLLQRSRATSHPGPARSAPVAASQATRPTTAPGYVAASAGRACRSSAEQSVGDRARSPRPSPCSRITATR